MRGYLSASDGEIITQTSKDTSKNMMELFPELNLQPSGRLTKIENTKSFLHGRVMLCVLGSIVLSAIIFLLLGFLIVDIYGNSSETDSLITLACCFSGLIAFISAVIAIKSVLTKVRISDMRESSDYYSRTRGKNSQCVIVVKNQKFGVWNFKKRVFQICPIYDSIAWQEVDKFLRVTINGETYVIDLYGERLFR